MFTIYVSPTAESLVINLGTILHTIIKNICDNALHYTTKNFKTPKFNVYKNDLN